MNQKIHSNDQSKKNRPTLKKVRISREAHDKLGEMAFWGHRAMVQEIKLVVDLNYSHFVRKKSGEPNA